MKILIDEVCKRVLGELTPPFSTVAPCSTRVSANPYKKRKIRLSKFSPSLLERKGREKRKKEPAVFRRREKRPKKTRSELENKFKSLLTSLFF